MLGIGIVLFFLFTQALKVRCAEEDGTTFCRGDSIVKARCEGNMWIDESVEECSTDQRCFEGICIDRECIGSEIKRECASHYILVETTCVNGVVDVNRIFCGEATNCENGECVPAPYTCGNGICEPIEGENSINCYIDCGSLSNWDEYHASVPDEIREKYTKCEAEFDCDDPIVQEAIDEMERIYEPKSPKEWIESASKWTYSKMAYSLSGGEAQCNTPASELLKDVFEKGYFTGNCVDASTILLAITRKKGVPGFHGGLCLSNARSWQCQVYSFAGIKKIGLPLGLGRIDGRLEGNVYGHAVSMLWNSQTQSFSIVDPTMNIGLVKGCWGYSEILEIGINNQVCYISNWQDLQMCSGF